MSELPTRTRGRPRHFDEETVLNDLTALFWQKGYRETSTADLVETSGVHKPSLYRTFGTKDELFATILRRYFTKRMEMISQLIDVAGPGIEGIHTFLELMEQDVISGSSQNGCLLVNSSAELCGTTPGFEHFGREYRNALRRQLRTLITKAGPEAGNTDSLTDQRTELFLNFLFGLNLSTRAGADETEIKQVVNAMQATVDTWADTTQPNRIL